MPRRSLEEVAKELFERLQKADEKYIQVQNKREKIINMEIITVKDLKVTSPRFKITTAEGTTLILTPSQFLKKKYIIIENGVEKRIVGI